MQLLVDFNPTIVRLKPPSESSSHAQHLGLYQRGTGQPPVECLFINTKKILSHYHTIMYFRVSGIDFLL